MYNFHGRYRFLFFFLRKLEIHAWSLVIAILAVQSEFVAMCTFT